MYNYFWLERNINSSISAGNKKKDRKKERNKKKSIEKIMKYSFIFVKKLGRKFLNSI